ncbi:MAG: TetR family transcriptional regulator [Candidatus Sulfotelmatobacter sp.]|nr:TetR family transcriptional regulator [Candidatus Sulfotelmatobacter sp.]
MASKAKRQILETAIDLFASEGYSGVGIRELAQAADVTPSSIFRLFESKEKLFDEVLETVVSSSLDPDEFSKLLEVGEKDLGQALHRALRRWYSSLTPRSARLLAYSALSTKEEWRELGFARTLEISKRLAEGIQAQGQKSRKNKLDATASARTLILSLLHVRSSRSLIERGEKEREVVDRMIQQWIQGVTPLR